MPALKNFSNLTKLSLCLGLAFSLSTYAKPKAVVQNGKMYQQTRKIPEFNQIIVRGNLDLNIHTGVKSAALVVMGQAADLAKLNTSVNKGVLTLSLPQEHKNRVTINAYSHYLNHLYYRGKGTVQATNLNSKMLDLDLANDGKTLLNGNIYLRQFHVKGAGYTEIKGISSRNLSVKISEKAKVQLLGNINLSQVELIGDSSLNMYWIKANRLQVQAKNSAFVKLAGVTQLLELELWGNAHFNGRYLRAKESFVKTHQHSLAEITTLGKEHTLATDASDIFFYYPAIFSNDFMARNGSVLDMRPWFDDGLALEGVWK